MSLSWLYINDRPRLQEKLQVEDQQWCISVFVAPLTIPSSNNPSLDVTAVFFTWAYGRFIEIYSQDIRILGCCPAGPVLPHGEKVPLYLLLATLLTALQIRAGQRSITANLWPLTAHIYHVMIIVTGGFSKK